MSPNPTQVAIIFAFVTFILSGAGLVSLFMMLPNEMQSRITQNDRAGWGITALGMLLCLLTVLLANKVFTPSIGIYDLSSYFAQISAMFAGALVFIGVTISLDDRITDPFLDQKNVKWLLLVVAIVIVILLLFVK
jgi:hypothetical protein